MTEQGDVESAPRESSSAFAAERRSLILRELRLHRSIQTRGIADRLAVSTMTIRRDLKALEDGGHLERVHGGAVAVTEGRPSRARPAPIATIGVVVPSATYYFPDVLRGVRAAAAAEGFRVVLAISDYSRARERDLISRLVHRGVDGLLVTPSDHASQDPDTFSLLEGSGLPAVVMERSLEGSGLEGVIDSVRCDHAVGARLAVEHLVAIGRQRIALAARPSATAALVEVGYRAAVRAADLEPVEIAIPVASESGDVRQEGIRRVLAAVERHEVDAVLVLPDEVAISLVDMAEDRGVGVPGDLAVIGYDDEVAAMGGTPVTAIAPPRFEVGRAAAMLCLRQVLARLRRERAIPCSRIELSPELRVRPTTWSTA